MEYTGGRSQIYANTHECVIDQKMLNINFKMLKKSLYSDSFL